MDKNLKPLILIVEDEEALSDVIKFNLEKEGYQVQIATRDEEALHITHTAKPDLIILDWILPASHLGGLEICKKIRSTPAIANTPIIMLTTRSEEIYKVTGLERGADDYVVKPFSSRELLARINAVLRRMRPAFANQVLQFEDITMELLTHTVIRNGKEIKLAPTEYQILQMLMEQPRRVFSREAFMDKIWGMEKYVGPRTVDVHIVKLRQALMEANPEGEDYIHTIRLAGYCLKSTKDKRGRIHEEDQSSM